MVHGWTTEDTCGAATPTARVSVLSRQERQRSRCLHLHHRSPPEHRPPRNYDLSITQLNAPRSCPQKHLRSLGPLQSSHSCAYLLNLSSPLPFRFTKAATHNVPRTPTGIYVTFTFTRSYISHTQSSLSAALVSQITTLRLSCDAAYEHDNTLTLL